MLLRLVIIYLNRVDILKKKCYYFKSDNFELQIRIKEEAMIGYLFSFLVIVLCLFVSGSLAFLFSYALYVSKKEMLLFKVGLLLFSLILNHVFTLVICGRWGWTLGFDVFYILLLILVIALFYKE